jgi:hypothetical protein
LHQILEIMRTVLFCCFWLIAISSAYGQVYMRPFDNAVAMSMGGATVSMPGLSAAIGNEAQLGLGGKAGVFAGTAIPYALAGWQSVNFQGFVGLGKTSGVGVSVLHAATELYAEQRFQLGYGRRLGDRFYLGATGDVWHNNAQEYGSETTATFSIGLLAQVLPTVWLGAKFQNPLQQKIGTNILPSVLRIGATWKASENCLISLETEKDLERTPQVKAGIEYRPVPVLAIRAGTRTGKVARMTFGAGLRLKNGVCLDVGSEWHPVLGITPAAMVSWRK